MSVQFKSNEAAVLKQFNSNKAALLTAWGINYTTRAVDEMDKGIYHAPKSESGYDRTGRLRAGQEYQVNLEKWEVLVGNTVLYAIFVELGTRYMMGYPFMRNAINAFAAEAEKLAREIMGKGFD